jgi:aminoglycoside 6'-N-acetyltransferase I
VKIRSVEPRDRAEWLRLLLALYENTHESDHLPGIDAFFCHGDSRSLLPSAVFVAERPDARLAGVLELAVREYAEGCEGATPYVESWFVDPDVRRLGVGRALLAAAERWAHDHRYEELASDALIDNIASQRAHAAVGFEEVERAVHFRKRIAPRDGG